MAQIPNIGNISTQMLGNAQKAQQDRRAEESHEINMMSEKIGQQTQLQQQQLNDLKIKQADLEQGEYQRKMTVAQNLRERLELNNGLKTGKQDPMSIMYHHAMENGDPENADRIHQKFIGKLSRVYKDRDAWERAYMGSWAQKKEPLNVSEDGKFYIFKDEKGGEQKVPRDLYYDSLRQENELKLDKLKIAGQKKKNDQIGKSTTSKTGIDGETKPLTDKEKRSYRSDINGYEKEIRDLNMEGSKVNMESTMFDLFAQSNPNIAMNINKGDSEESKAAKARYIKFAEGEIKRIRTKLGDYSGTESKSEEGRTSSGINFNELQGHQKTGAMQAKKQYEKTGDKAQFIKVLKQLDIIPKDPMTQKRDIVEDKNKKKKERIAREKKAKIERNKKNKEKVKSDRKKNEELKRNLNRSGIGRRTYQK